MERAYAPSTEDSHQALWRRVNTWRQLRRNGRPYSPWSNHPERTNEVRARSLQSSVQITIRNRTEGSAVAIVTQSHAPRPPTSITASTASTIQHLNRTSLLVAPIRDGNKMSPFQGTRCSARGQSALTLRALRPSLGPRRSVPVGPGKSDFHCAARYEIWRR